MKSTRFLLFVVPSLFFLAMIYVTTVAYLRTSGITGMDAADIQAIRARASFTK